MIFFLKFRTRQRRLTLASGRAGDVNPLIAQEKPRDERLRPASIAGEVYLAPQCFRNRTGLTGRQRHRRPIIRLQK